MSRDDFYAAPPQRASTLERFRRWRKKQRDAFSAFFVVAIRLAPYARKRRGKLLLALGWSIGFMAMRLAEPWPLKLIFDHVLLDVPLPGSVAFLADWTGGERLPLLAVLVGAIVAVALLSGLFYYQQNVLSAKLGQQMVTELRQDAYEHALNLSFTFHDRRRTGDLLVRLITDIRLLRDAVVKLPLELAENSLLILGMSIIMLFMDWQLALISFALLPLLAILVQRYRKPMKRQIRRQREQEGHVATLASDALGAIRAIHGYQLEGTESRRFGGANTKTLKHGVKAARLEARMRWASDLSVGLITAAVVGFAAHRILAGELSPGALIIFVTYLRQYARPLRRISRTTERVARTAAAGDRLLEILDREPDVRDLPGARPLEAVSGSIEWDRVSLRHGSGPWVLRDVSVRVPAGQRVAVVGPTGAGKSTLVSLVPRFYDPDEGCVRIDDLDVRSVTLESLRSQVAFVFQEPILFAESIADNIARGRPDATREDVVAAARRAGIGDVIESLAEGYDTVIGERGGTLSGGQRQCLSIARAILRDAPIVVLDEPTTGLDQRATTLVTEALDRLMEGRTVLMISHDLSSLHGIQRVVVIDDGRVVQDGTPDALRATEGLFRELEQHGERSRGSS